MKFYRSPIRSGMTLLILILGIWLMGAKGVRAVLPMDIGLYTLGQVSRTIQNPVLPRGAVGSWDSYYTAEPMVLYEPTTNHYLMWYFGLSLENPTPSVGLAVSTNGISWSRYSSIPIFSEANLDNGLNNQLYGASFTGPQKANVVKHENQYYMYYRADTKSTTRPLYCINSVGVGESSTSYIGIGVAMSNNPYSGWHDLGIKILPQKCSDTFKVDTPSVIYDEEEAAWKMWFSAGKGSRNEPRVWHLANSADGISWNVLKDGDGLDKDIAIPPPTNTTLSGGLGGIQIIKNNGYYYNFFNGFTVYDPTKSQDSGFSNIFVTRSIDGLNWNLNNESPIIKRGIDDGRPTDFDSKHAYRPFFVFGKNGKCYLYYNGKGASGGEEIGVVNVSCTPSSFGSWFKEWVGNLATMTDLKVLLSTL